MLNALAGVLAYPAVLTDFEPKRRDSKRDRKVTPKVNRRALAPMAKRDVQHLGFLSESGRRAFHRF
jgi:hypothetical protein